VLKPQLAARVGQLKESKKTLEANKTILADLKAAIGELKASSEDGALDQAKAKEKEFVALRTQMQADATELKSSYADYEAQLKDFKAKEGELQSLYARFHINDEAADAADGAKPRRLLPEQQERIERLLSVIGKKSTERDALKALAEEVNVKNTQLKALKAERETHTEQQKQLQMQLDAMPPADTDSSTQQQSSGGGPPKMVKKTFMRTVTRRVKKPKRGGKRAAPMPSLSIAAGTSVAHVPSVLLTSLKPIELRGGGSRSKFPPRDFVPVTPTVFKPPTSTEEAAPAPVAAAAGSDPALQAKYDALQVRVSKLQAELDALQASSGGSSDALAAKEQELAALRSQLRVLEENEADERVKALSAQLAAQRADVDAAQTKHQQRLAEVNKQSQAARQESEAKQAEIAKLRADLQAMQDKLKQANARAAAATAASAAAGGGGGGDGGGGGVPGGVDPAIVAGLHGRVAELESTVAELESTVTNTSAERDAHAATISQLQARVAQLEQEAAAHTGSLAQQLDTLRTELTTSHTARVTELETSISESAEKLRVTKKKAKELHEALQAETVRREGLETNVATLTSTISTMEISTKEALDAVDGLKSNIAQLDAVVETKTKTIAELEGVREKLQTEVAFLEVRNAEEIKRRKEFQFKFEGKSHACMEACRIVFLSASS